MADPITIRAEQLSKCYRVFSSPRARLAQGLWRRRTFYQPFWALKDVSFQLEAGHTMGVVGRNGSGKSTLLQLLCGTLTPTSGTMSIEGRVAALLELGSGFNDICNPECIASPRNILLKGVLQVLPCGTSVIRQGHLPPIRSGIRS